MQKTAFFCREPQRHGFREVSKTTVGSRLGRQIYLAMKLTALLLTVAILHVSARGFSQTISYSGKEVSLKTVFSVIKKQTGFTVFYDQTLLEKTKPVSVEAKDQPLEAFLNNVLEGQSLDYSIEQKAIVITRKPPTIAQAAPSPEPVTTPTGTITGKVTTKEGEPLAGASVVVKKTNKGTTTDAKGQFTLSGVDPDDEIVVSFTGYESHKFKAGNGKAINIVLSHVQSALDEVQVVAYGTTTQRYTTSNVTTVTSQQIERQPVTNPLLALQGLVPGLVIQQQSGYANAGIAVDIRGQSSLVSGSAPLYVIDGIPYFGQMLPSVFLGQGYSGSGASQFGAQNGNTLAFINTADIESISVLKDADATSIYGSRAAGGAILITTKKGKSGPLRVTANLSQGWQKVTRNNQMMNSTQYLEMRHEAMNNSGATPGPTDYDLNGAWDTTRNTNWEKVLLGGTGHWSEENLNISGGGANTQYYISGTYHKESPYYINPNNLSDQKISGYMSLNSTSANGRFTAQANMAYQYDDNKLPGYDLTNFIMALPPVAPALYNADGTLNWQMYNGAESWNNPLAAIIYQPTEVKTYNLVAKARMGYKILTGLELAADAGYTFMQNNQFEGTGLDAYAPSIRQYVQRQAQFSNGYQTGWNVEPQLNYHKDWKNGHLETLGGATFTQSLGTNQSFYASGFISDALMQDPRAASTLQYAGTTYDLYKYNAYFIKASYRWEDRYIVSVSGRHDGSSRFGPDNKFHTFGSVAASWIFSNERFLKNSNVLSFGKLTTSYGTVGNEQIGDYQYLSTYYSYALGSSPYQGVTGLTLSGLANPNLQWEVQRKLETRLDLGFVHDRILLSANYYRDRSSNQLLNYQLPNFVGFPNLLTNFPATIQNSGSEVTLQTTNIKNQSFSWSTKLNLTFRGNKLVAFPNLMQSSYFGQVIIGQAFSGLRRTTSAGVNPQTGLFQFRNVEGKLVGPSELNYPQDQYEFINTQPTYFGGLSNSFAYKGFQLDFFFQFSNSRIPNIKQLNYRYPGQGLVNQPVIVLNRWQKPGDNAEFQAFETSPTGDQLNAFYNTMSSSFIYAKEYYVRLKNISLQWQLPKALLSKLDVKECSVFFRAQNLWTKTNYLGSDPESGAFSLPVTKVIDAGIKAIF